VPSDFVRSMYPRRPGAYPTNPPAWSLFVECFINGVYAMIAPGLTTRLLAVICAISGILLIECAISSNGVDMGASISDFVGGMWRGCFPFFMGVFIARHKPRFLTGNATSLILAVGVTFILANSLIEASSFYDLLAVVVAFPSTVYIGISCINTVGLSRVFKWLGGLSYPLYAVHWPICIAITQEAARLHLDVSCYSIAVTCMLASLFGATFLWKCWDIPVRRRFNYI
jgi:peptidoglycan/LPS O-acetylase OafA/YrhL